MKPVPDMGETGFSVQCGQGFSSSRTISLTVLRLPVQYCMHNLSLFLNQSLSVQGQAEGSNGVLA